MDIRKIRAEMYQGRSIFDLPLRVTFYARVSTEQDEQRNSLENQVQYYTELIQSRENWTYVPGYVDEGVSGTGTKRRDAFNRMIRDAAAGRFDFIITKEISRFSRSTLDSIRYTQELLAHNVGVYFQNDNINTLDGDSEFRLVIMAGVAQDEVRKLSERLKFGFRQAIQNGHVLGNDRLYGYDKKDCVLTVNEEEAKIVRTVFDLYANHGYGTRKISQKLLEMGYTSRAGNAFNTLTIRHMLENPKYKGWYCGNKTRNLDYRTRKKAVLDEREWVMYPDPNIPAIVPEALWDRANARYRQRRQAVLARSGASCRSRYPYSGKILCEEHGTSFHRQISASSKGGKEMWMCKVYRQQGRAACAAPHVRGAVLDAVMAQIFTQELRSRQAVIDTLMAVLTRAADGDGQCAARAQAALAAARQKKLRLLDLHLDGAVAAEVFRARDAALDAQIRDLEARCAAAQTAWQPDPEAVRRALEQALRFAGSIDAALAAAILARAVVKRGSSKAELRLEIVLRSGARFEAVCAPADALTGISISKSITHRKPIRRI